MQVFYIFLFLLIFFSTPTFAQVQDLPDNLKGVWAVPDCSQPEKIVYHSKTHVLYITDEEATLDTARVNKVNPDYLVIQNGGDVYPVQIHNDGIMEIGILAKGRRLDSRLSWDQLPLDKTRQYLRCEMQPPLPHDIAPSAMDALDVMEHFCRDGTNEGCLRETFKHFDYDASAAISTDEAVKASIIATYLAPLLDYRPFSTINIKRNLTPAYDQSVRFINGAYKVTDANLDGVLSYDELDYAYPILLPELQEQNPYQAITRIMSIYPKLYQ